MALRARAYAHYLLIAGIVTLAAGVKKAVGHAFEPLPLGAGPSTISTGAALYPGRPRVVPPDHAGLRGARYRFAAAVAVLAVIPLGPLVAVAQLAAIPLIMAAALITEDIPGVRRAGNTAIHTFGRTGPAQPPDGGPHGLIRQPTSMTAWSSTCSRGYP